MPEKSLRAVFDEIDADLDGFIAPNELQSVLHVLGIKLTSKEVGEVLHTVDRDHDGKITFEEFCEVFAGIPDFDVYSVARYVESFRHMDSGSDLAVPLPPAHVSPLHFFLAGACGGIASRTIAAPLDRLKIVSQTSASSDSTVLLLQREVQVSGWRSLFQGNGAALLRVAPFSGLVTLTYSSLVAVLPCDDVMDTREPLYRFSAGVMAATVGTVITYPLDTVRARLAIQRDGARKYTGISHALKTIVREEGARGLYQGLRPTLIAAAPFIGIQQTVFDSVRMVASERFGVKETVPACLSYGALAGIVAQGITHPVDLVRRRMQTMVQIQQDDSLSRIYGSVNHARYQYTRVALKQIFQEESVFGLYRGFGAATAKVAPTIAVSVLVRDFVLNRVHVDHN